ncbi:MAG: hypothetical protein KatS3mg102_0103 [Planctomycetota bacterium]|nr:MAG: hypothetical protein KatS3mg102_0103 [Planctomycetota bacterium]
MLEDGGRRLVLRTGGASYELRREAPPAPAPANPLAGGGAMPPGPPAPTGRDQEPAAGPPPGPPAPPVPAGPGQDPGAWAPPAPAPRGEPAPAAQAPGPWRDFAHPAGVLFSVPPGWTARLQAAGAQTVAVLVPPDLAVDADGDAMETYLVSTEALDPSARDIAPTDPRIQQGIAQGMSQQFPVPLRAQGPPERVAGKGYEAGRMRWTASSPDGSQLIVVECWVRVVEGKLVVVTGLGLAEQVARREPLVRRVMESIRPAPPGGVK